MTIPDLFERPSVQKRAARTYLSMVTGIDAYAQDLADAGKVVTAAVARQRARIAHSAWLAEEQDPEPSDPIYCDCDECRAYLWRDRR